MLLKVLLCVFLLIVVPGGRAETWHVAPGGTGDGSSRENALPDIASAYARAGEGDVIELAAGEYGAQPKVLPRKDTEGWTSNITARPAPGAVATIGGAEWLVLGPRLTLENLRFTVRVAVRAGADHFRMEKCQSRVQPGQVASLAIAASHCAVIDNLFDGGSGDADGLVIANGSAGPRASDILVEGNTIRNYLYQAGGLHEDGIQLYDCENVTIRRNRIINVGNSAIILSGGRKSQPMPGLRIENNFISRGDSTSRSITVDIRYPHATGLVCVNNTILGSVSATANEGNILRNNIIAWLSSKGSNEDHNLVVEFNKGIGVKISDTSIQSELPEFINREEGDLRIAPSNGIDLAFGNPAAAPADDFDGRKRGAAVMVGAHDPTASPPP